MGDTARGPLMLRLTMVDTDMAATATARGLLMPTMVVMDMAAMDTARGQLMPRLTMVDTDMAATATARGLPMPTMVVTDTAVTDTARGPLMPTMAAMAMAAMDTASNLTMEENHSPKKNLIRILS